MNSRLMLKTPIALACTLGLALLVPSPASACRIGWDQQLFPERPPTNALRGARAIRVHFSNARPGIDRWPRHVANPHGGPFTYTLIGVARRLDDGRPTGDSFPVYAVVTSCSGFFSMNFGEVRTVVEGDYWLIGRFSSGERDRHFYAGGRRMAHGRDIYEGSHF